MSHVADSVKYDVAIVGAGPAGAGYAAMLKAIDPERSICVVDIRAETRRSYSLSVAKDTIVAIHAVLQNNLNHVEDPVEVRKFMAALKKWQGSAVSAQKIEEKLGKWAKRFGVAITREVKYKEALTAQEIDKLLAHQEDADLTETQLELRDYFRQALVITGAAGAHCPVRQRYMDGGDEEKRVDVQNLQYFIEMKYQTDGKTKSRKITKLMKQSSCEGVGFETMPKVDNKPKFATIHFFVGKTTYEAFAQATDKDPWDLDRLQTEAYQNPIVENMTRKIAHYLQGLIYREGTCIQPRIKRLPITIYRSAEVVKVHEGRVIVEVGDALSGAVFARGVNKALKEAARLAQHTKDFFQSRQPIEEGRVPEAFRSYETEVLQIFDEERKTAEFKAKWIGYGRIVMRWILKPIRIFFSPFQSIYRSFISIFFKEPTLGQLMTKIQGPSKPPGGKLP